MKKRRYNVNELIENHVCVGSDLAWPSGLLRVLCHWHRFHLPASGLVVRGVAVTRPAADQCST